MNVLCLHASVQATVRLSHRISNEIDSEKERRSSPSLCFLSPSLSRSLFTTLTSASHTPYLTVSPLFRPFIPPKLLFPANSTRLLAVSSPHAPFTYLHIPIARPRRKGTRMQMKGRPAVLYASPRPREHRPRTNKTPTARQEARLMARHPQRGTSPRAVGAARPLLIRLSWQRRQLPSRQLPCQTHRTALCLSSLVRRSRAGPLNATGQPQRGLRRSRTIVRRLSPARQSTETHPMAPVPCQPRMRITIL